MKRPFPGSQLLGNLLNVCRVYSYPTLSQRCRRLPPTAVAEHPRGAVWGPREGGYGSRPEGRAWGRPATGCGGPRPRYWSSWIPGTDGEAVKLPSELLEPERPDRTGPHRAVLALGVDDDVPRAQSAVGVSSHTAVHASAHVVIGNILTPLPLPGLPTCARRLRVLASARSTDPANDPGRPSGCRASMDSSTRSAVSSSRKRPWHMASGASAAGTPPLAARTAAARTERPARDASRFATTQPSQGLQRRAGNRCTRGGRRRDPDR